MPNPKTSSVILGRQLIVDIPYQAYPHLGRVVAPQHVADEVRLDLRLHHLEGAAQHAAEDVGVPQLVLGAAVVGQLDKVGQRVLLEDERELLRVAGPVGYGGRYVEEDLEPDLEEGDVSTEEGWRRGRDRERGRALAIISAVSLKF